VCRSRGAHKQKQGGLDQCESLEITQHETQYCSGKMMQTFGGIENLVASDSASAMQVAGLHGGGSPQMETITMTAHGDKALKHL